ncbi:acyl-CoA dehydrogenase [Morchella conica CCBAS932]|uniref:Acyl-CoA dehydrogenase n=1 Tax=Morchella conica CCBAS932 TaxID=1392247 RepID=A0A3N4L1L2_9PEZI|nr:acyl-CoA dehydrogenase [Morchella conica CCBAS932]
MTAPVPLPFSEPAYLTGAPNPYYSPSHLAWQKACRAFITANLTTHALDWERAEEVPPSVFDTFSAAHMLIPALPGPLPIAWLKRLGIHTLLGGLPVEEFDYMHFLIHADEMARSGLAGPGASLTTGMAYGVPPIIKYGSKELQERVLPDLLMGRARACIAITEPGAGSDVAGIEATAVRSEDGGEYVVNGQKKWITNGIWANYATTAVRTGGPGPGGLSLLLISLQSPGVTLRKLAVTGMATSGTTFITLEDVRVPISNLIGAEGQGMKMIMTNFNHERLSIAIATTRQARVAVSSALEYVLAREAFGKALVEQAVVRHRLAKVGARVESQWAWVESVAWRMRQGEADMGGVLALVKASAGMVLAEAASTAVVLLGGNGLTRSGRGELVERIYRDVPGAVVPGGSEDVMLDLGVRELVKNYRKAIRKLEAGSKL